MKEYTTVLGDTFDKVALQVYGDESYINDLLLANPEHVRNIVFKSNIKIKCPEISKETNYNLPPWKRG